ncbi:MAG: hypothetical protein RR425_01075, partial [Erysipelotrichales bacterium]
GLKKNSFDLVYVFDNILYWEDLEKALSGIHVLMRDNASLIIAERIIYLNDDIQLLIEGLIKELGFNDFRVIEDEQFVMYQINK